MKINKPMKMLFHNNMLRCALSAGFILCLSAMAFGQQTNWNKEGEIESAEVVISKERELTLPLATRNFEKIPPLQTTTQSLKQSFRFVDVPFKLPVIEPRVRALAYSPEKQIQNNYHNRVSLGFGNYLSPFGNLSINSMENEKVAAGLDLTHRSFLEGPVDSRNSGNGSTKARIYGKAFSDSEMLSGSMSYENQFLHYYGYPQGMEITNRDSIRQVFKIFNSEVGIQSIDPAAMFNYSLNGDFTRITDEFEKAESTYFIGGSATANVIDDFKFHLQSSVRFTKLEAVDYKIDRQLFQIRPSVSYSLDGLDLEGGFNLAYQKDTISENEAKLFPYVQAKFRPVDGLQIYANVDGGIEMNTYHSLSSENPFIADSIGLKNTIRKLGFGGGLKGFISSYFSVHVGADFGIYNRMPFFVNAFERTGSPDSIKFDVLYDRGDVQRLNAFAELGFSLLNRGTFTLRGDYFQYTMEQLSQAWHMPNFKGSLLSNWRITDQFSFSTEMYYLSGIQARDFISFEEMPTKFVESAVPLENIIDLNLRLEYKITDQFSIFGSGNNLLGKEYQRFYNYPGRGLQVLGGLTWRF
jgi:hypothetical protein